METSVSRRPWESESHPPHTPQAPTPQTLPSISTLTSSMGNPPLEKASLNLSMSAVQRDSGNWSTPQSTLTGSSSYSTNTMPYLNSSHQSPNRLSGQGGSQLSQYTPDSSAGPSPGFGSSPQAQTLPSIGQNYDALPHRVAADLEESRRSSVDSRIHQGMNNLALGPSSPYASASANASQASIVSGLQRERGIPTNGYRGPRYSGSGQISMSSRLGERGSFTAGRIAPPIIENPKAEVYNAEAPTAGQPYAFPDPDAGPGRPGSTFSRRESIAESISSSIYTTDSRLPHGQQELPGGTHHHSLQHKQLTDIMDDPDSPNSQTPYSRTPELRVTHKLAERKRRSEMKDCFEMLRARLPANSNNKSSKWETLTRAIDYISGLEAKNQAYRNELDKQRQHIGDMELKIKELSQQLQRLQQHGSYQTPPSAIAQSSMGFGNHYGNGMENNGEQTRTLPPMNGTMQGIQYSDERR